MALSFTDNNGNTAYTHASLMDESKVERLQQIHRSKLNAQYALGMFNIAAGLALVNTRAPFKNMPFAQRAAAFIGFDLLLGSLEYYIIKSTYNTETLNLYDGVAVWDSPQEVSDLTRRYFHLDDEQDFKPSLWHHGCNQNFVERAQRIFRANSQ